MKHLYTSWQNPYTRDWFVVGMLYKQNNEFVFQYTKGALVAQENQFNLFTSFIDINKIYISDDIFPMFQNRLMPRSRQDFPQYLQWLQLDNTASELDQLARNGGKTTDTIEMFPAADFNEATNQTSLDFFIHGLSHASQEVIERSEKLVKNEWLPLMLDYQNKRDANAVMLRMGDDKDALNLRYIPRYLAPYTHKLYAMNINHEVRVVANNLNAPVQFRLLCKLTTEGNTENVFATLPQFEPLLPLLT